LKINRGGKWKKKRYNMNCRKCNQELPNNWDKSWKSKDGIMDQYYCRKCGHINNLVSQIGSEEIK
jgi:hypothetical protein